MRSFKSVIKTGFNQRRKTLRNSLKPILGKDSQINSMPVLDKNQNNFQ
jgi:16S rRNA (adenine1518-N6/adenine1519-N6)-dimethyltransferase